MTIGNVARATQDLFMRVPGRPPTPRGALSTGRIVKLFVGQGYGFIRVGDDREIFFHRADVCEGTSINHLEVGDLVTFEIFEDGISGPRALQVRPRSSSRLA